MDVRMLGGRGACGCMVDVCAPLVVWGGATPPRDSPSVHAPPADSSLRGPVRRPACPVTDANPSRKATGTSGPMDSIKVTLLIPSTSHISDDMIRVVYA